MNDIKEIKMDEQTVLFDQRFIESYTGEQLLKNPITALVELIANSWDAGKGWTQC